jgi:Resolvase, N terminal domain
MAVVDSDRRQREAIAAFASRAGYELVGEFYDAAVSGADPIDTRPGFAAMLERIEGNGVRTILVETARGHDPRAYMTDSARQDLGDGGRHFRN